MTDLRFNALPCGCAKCGCLCKSHAPDRIESPCWQHVLASPGTPGTIPWLIDRAMALEENSRTQRHVAKPALPTAARLQPRETDGPANSQVSAFSPPFV